MRHSGGVRFLMENQYSLEMEVMKRTNEFFILSSLNNSCIGVKMERKNHVLSHSLYHFTSIKGIFLSGCMSCKIHMCFVQSFHLSQKIEQTWSMLWCHLKSFHRFHFYCAVLCTRASFQCACLQCFINNWASDGQNTAKTCTQEKWKRCRETSKKKWTAQTTLSTFANTRQPRQWYCCIIYLVKI